MRFQPLVIVYSSSRTVSRDLICSRGQRSRVPTVTLIKVTAITPASALALVGPLKPGALQHQNSSHMMAVIAPYIKVIIQQHHTCQH